MNELLALLALTSTAAAHHHHGGGDLGPEPFVAEAVQAHPSIAAAERRAEAMRARTAPAGALMDPMVSIGVQNLPYAPPSLTATPMTGIRFGISQTFPWPGKRGLAEEAATSRADAADAGTLEQRNRLAAMVRSTFYEIHFVDVAINVIRANLEIIDGFIEIADAKYRVGRGLQQDILKARVTKNQLDERLIGLRRQRATLRVRINSLMARDPGTRIPRLIDVRITELPPLEAEHLLATASEHRPLLRRLAAQIAAADQSRALADKAALPDFNLAFGYTLRLVEAGRDPIDGDDFVSLTAGVNLPVWSSTKQGPLAEAAAKDAAAARRELEAATLDVRETVQTVLEQTAQLLEQMELYRSSIIPTTRQSLDADRIAYQVDKVDFLNLLDIEMRLLSFEVDYHRLHVEREKLIVQLAEAVGVAPSELGRNR
ncbi:MAG: TolC family protein [Deltaproteobacteria bacterium]